MIALFTPLTVKKVTFRNRIVMPPMVNESGDEEGRVTKAALRYYRERAAAGTAMIIVEATAVDEKGRCWRTGLGAYSDRQIPSLQRLSEAIRAEGGVAAVQLVHGGPQGAPELAGGETVGPSAVAPSPDAPLPRALTVEEIHAIEQRFADAAGSAVQAGFQAVEVHGAHGFLLDSFLSSARNRRTDAYGGLISNRARMLVEACERVRERIGADPLLICRISVFNKRAEGFSQADLQVVVQGLESAGVDILHISTDGAFKGHFGAGKSIGKWAREFTGLPIIVAGGLGDPRDAERAVADGHCDLAAVGTAMMSDAEWTKHAAEVLSV
jgi:2,4-dienoyl-CoA reductase-like NADH-dependent reductase (Old Yellow Enzyme family)